MAKGFSFAQIGGVLGREPESRSTPKGVKVTNFSVAVEKWSKDGPVTNWFNVVAFDKNAEFAEKSLKKGSSVVVAGDLQIKNWEDKNGQKRTTTEILAHKIDFADSGSSSGGQKQERSAPAPQTRQQAAPQTRAATTENPFEDDDSMPF